MHNVSVSRLDFEDRKGPRASPREFALPVQGLRKDGDRVLRPSEPHRASAQSQGRGPN